jgi:hypothetical protein
MYASSAPSTAIDLHRIAPIVDVDAPITAHP